MHLLHTLHWRALVAVAVAHFPQTLAHSAVATQFGLSWLLALTVLGFADEDYEWREAKDEPILRVPAGTPTNRRG